MSFSPLSFVESLSFVRYGGTPAELQAAELIRDEIARAGGQSQLMPFSIAASATEHCSVRVCAPYEKQLHVTPLGMCDCIPAPGRELRLFYAERCTERDLLGRNDLSDTAVLVNSLSLASYKLLCKRNAAAILVSVGLYYHSDGEAGIYARNLRPKFLENGAIPTFSINAAQAIELVRDGAERIHIELVQQHGEATSHNVLAEIEGTELPCESIVLTAHYDSLPLGPGAYDNATGTAVLLGLYRYFMKNPPRRTLRFIWCGSEEQGLLGSKAYIEQKEALLEEIQFCFNFDMLGAVLGHNQLVVTGSRALETFAEQFCRETGYSAEISLQVRSSDSACFADRGIPSIDLCRRTATSVIHTVNDDLFPIGERALLDNIDFAARLITRVANSAVLPVDTGMPEDMRGKLDKYFLRDK